MRRGTHAGGHVKRHGTRLITLAADLATDHGSGTGEGVNFNYKAIPATDGTGFESAPVLTCARFALTLRTNLSGPGAVRLAGTVHDPLDDIGVVKILRGVYCQGDLIARAETLAKVDPDAFLPYALGRTDDWSQLDTESRPLTP